MLGLCLMWEYSPDRFCSREQAQLRHGGQTQPRQETPSVYVPVSLHHVKETHQTARKDHGEAKLPETRFTGDCTLR